MQVTTDGKTATYHLWTGPPLTVWHEGEPFDLGDDDVKLLGHPGAGRASADPARGPRAPCGKRP